MEEAIEVTKLRERIVELENEIFQRDMEKVEDRYYVSKICGSKDVYENENILAYEYVFKDLIGLVRKYGFEKVNDYLVAKSKQYFEKYQEEGQNE